MVARKRLRTILTALGLYVLAALLIGYFGVNAYSGDRGLRAQQDIERQMAVLGTERDGLIAERQHWQRRIALLKSGDLDPDMLDERVRDLLDYVASNEVTMMVAPKPHTAATTTP